MSEGARFDLIDQEILIGQLIAIMDAHWHRPDAAEKLTLLQRASRRVQDSTNLCKSI